MKKKVLALFLALLATAVLPLRAQTLVDYYRFSTRVDATAWMDITGVDSALIATPDSGVFRYDNSAVTDIGFTFAFGGTDYTQFSVNLNGVLRLGPSRVPVSSQTNPLTRTLYMPMVNAYGAAGEMDSSCHLRCATLGTAGNRVLVVEARLKVFNSDSSYVSWQTQLHEATGEVLVVYGPSANTGALPVTQPGLAKTVNDILFIDHATHTVQRFVSTAVPTNGAGLWPEAGRCYSFVPDMAACPYPPAVAMEDAPFDSVRLAWGGVFGGTAWRLTIPLVGIDSVLTDTSFTFGGLEPYTDFTGTLQSICGGDSSLRQRPFSFNSGCGTVHLLPWNDDFQAAVTNDCWAKPYKTSGNRWQRQTSNNNYYMRAGYSTVTSTVYNEWLISPPVVLPDTVGLTLHWWYQGVKLSNVTPKVRVRLLVCDTLDVADTTAAWVTLDTLDDSPSYFQQFQLRLDAYAGHRVRVAFQRFGKGGQYAYLDEVGIEVLTQPGVSLQAPASTRTADTTVVVAEFTAGVLANPQYTWHSTMDDRGEALVLSAADTLKIVYSASGIDTVTVTLTTDYGTATATTVIYVADCQPVTSFPWREGFEHGLDCWDMPTSGPNVWELRTTGAHSGQRVACAREHDVYNPFDTLVSQPIVVPDDAHGLTLMWWMRHDGGSGPSTFRKMMVKALNAANPVWSSGDSLFYRNSTDIPTTWQQFSVDLEPLAGQTVRFAWAGSSYSNSTYIYIDDIEIRYTREPVISLAAAEERLLVDDTADLTLTMLEGDTVGATYMWSSTMADHGLADYIGGGQQSLRLAYHGAGLDTIVVFVINAYGTATDTAMVRVCPKYDTLPWVADFASEISCWQVLEGSCSVHSSGYLSLEDWPTTVVSPPVYVPDDGNVVLEYDCGYSFFYGSTLVMVTTDMTTFDTLIEDPFVTGTHPSTRLPLGAYAGQYVRVVFKATGQFLQFYLASVQIRYALEPVVQVVSDDGYFPGTPVTLTASLLEGDTVNLIYSWTSTLTQRGDATLTFDGGPQATLVPSVGGSDTVTVWATNNHGTDSTTIVVNIKPCAMVDSLPWVEDFSNQFTCWWQPAGSQWSPDNTGSMACVINYPTTGDNWLVSRAIELPYLLAEEGEGLQLWWDAAAIFANGHTYSVWITTGDYRDTNSYDLLATYSSPLPAYNSGWKTPRIDLSAYAGDTVHLAFRYQTHYYEVSGIPGILAIDSVRIFDTRPPQVAIVPPARCFVDDTVVYCANHVHGVRSGMTYTWQSTMAQQGLATTWVVDSLFYVVYHIAGYDTVSLIATNAYGSDTAMVWRQVKGCPAVTVPWHEDFEVANPCWSGSWVREQMTYLANDSTTYVVQSNPNSWYASPWIDLPDTVGLQLMWNKQASSASSFMKIFVSPTGSIEPADFTDTLLYRQTPLGYDSVSLDAYAGRRIRVAFAQLTSSNYSDVYALDDIRVDYNRTAPQVSLTAPVLAALGDTITAIANLSVNAQGVTYSWSSTMMGSLTPSPSPTGEGSEVHLLYTAPGTDTITVIATNLYGSDTAWAVVTVIDCSGRSVPYFEDFNGTLATNVNGPGVLPPCWETVWNGSVEGLAPHVIFPGGYSLMSNIPDNALFMVTSNYQTYDTLAEVRLPRMADSLQTLSLAFDYRFENAGFGTLTAGYYNGLGEYEVIKTMTPSVGSYSRDTVHFTTATVADAQMVLRWSQGMVGYAVLIDNIEVFHTGTVPLLPQVAVSGPATVDAFDTVTFTATLQQCDTTGLTYTWHSSLLGGLTPSPSPTGEGSSVQLAYTVVGTDTLTCIATNAYGADTAMLIVNVQWPATWTHTVTVASADSTMGLVALGTRTSPADSLTVAHGNAVTFRSIALAGYHFVRWSDGATEVLRTVTVVSDTLFVAYFEADTPDTVWHTVTVNANVVGAAEPYGSGTYAHGDTAEIGYQVLDTLAVGGHWTFLGWSDGVQGNPRSIVVESDTVITALFEWVADSVGIDQTGTGSWSMWPNPAHAEVMIRAESPTTVLLVDVTGREVLRADIPSGNTKVDISSLSRGVYYVRLKESVGVKKLIVR
ncbi:MAG: T9SS type A sorting domain-containing protein [Bacteroidales bacterium]|nr:T9SS type A sorting domain-containing protein [Bacteroidales bacterium]